uniref:Uncharacterized protein n=1 Tax=Sinocyclocheilus anshuiensis TaxID=1608454 RepID=A0A671L0R5_9TELE
MTLTVSRGEGLTVITILGFLCYSPVCSVSQGIKKGKLKDVHTALGIVQMIIGVLNIGVGFVFTCLGSWFTMDRIAQAPFWLCSVVRLGLFLIICMFLNQLLFSAALAITAVVLYSVDLANNHAEYCENYKLLFSIDIMMIALSVLQICVTISFCVLTGKALCKKDEDVKVLYHQHYYNNQSVKSTVIMKAGLRSLKAVVSDAFSL